MTRKDEIIEKIRQGAYGFGTEKPDREGFSEELKEAGTNFIQAELPKACLQEAPLDNANFSNALLIGAEFDKASLVEAKFEGANLGGAELEKANFNGADLRDADLRGAQLWGAHMLGTPLEDARITEDQMLALAVATGLVKIADAKKVSAEELRPLLEARGVKIEKATVPAEEKKRVPQKLR